MNADELVAALRAEQGLTAGLRARAAQRPIQLILPEGEDPRVAAAAAALAATCQARPVLLGNLPALRRALGSAASESARLACIDPQADRRADAIAQRLFERRRAKGLTQGEAHVLARDPLHFGAGMVAMGEADAMVGGAVRTTADVVRAGLYHAGMADGVAVASSSFLMVPAPEHWLGRPLLFADAGVIPAPDEDQLVAIGVASARTFKVVLERDPLVACLSFSTYGSADHPAARRMAQVARRLRQLGVQADGELQADAALLPRVAAAKAPKSPVAGRADVLLFPDLGAANIGYKLVERLGGFTAIGPLLQGLARPIFDLSRGCSARDIVNTAAIAALFCRTAAAGGGKAPPAGAPG